MWQYEAKPYSHAEWAHSNLENYRFSKAARTQSEAIRNQAIELVEDRKARTNRTQADASLKLHERAKDIKTWKKDLQRELDVLTDETAALNKTRRELEHARSQAKRPEEIINHCQSAREYRVGVDQVTDSVQGALKAELKEIKRIQRALAQHHDDIEGQILDNEAVMAKIKVDLRQKMEALDIDKTCFTLENDSHEIEVHPGVHEADSTRSNPQGWIKYSDKNIEDATKAKFKSTELRGNVDGLLSSACLEMMTAWSICNRSFKERILETEETHSLLNVNLSATIQEIADLDEHINIIKQGLKEKRPPLKVAETRLAFRTHRPNVEACYDTPHSKLVDEVVEINDSVCLLTTKLTEAEDARAMLIQARSSLRQDIRVKDNSLRIDREKCMSQRLRFPYNQRCSRDCSYKWCQNIANFMMARTAENLHLADNNLRQYDGGHAA